MQSFAVFPKDEGSVGTVRQPKKDRPSSLKISSKRFSHLSRFLQIVLPYKDMLFA
jgi:hypothetical protein